MLKPNFEKADGLGISKDIENETLFILEFGCLHLEQQIVG